VAAQCMARGTRDLRRAPTADGGSRKDGAATGRAAARELELDVLRCDSWELLSMSPITFFSAYAAGGYFPGRSSGGGASRSGGAGGTAGADDGGGLLLKLKDYPPAASFSEVLSRHNQVCRAQLLCGTSRVVHLVSGRHAWLACTTMQLPRWRSNACSAGAALAVRQAVRARSIGSLSGTVALATSCCVGRVLAIVASIAYLLKSLRASAVLCGLIGTDHVACLDGAAAGRPSTVTAARQTVSDRIWYVSDVSFAVRWRAFALPLVLDELCCTPEVIVLQARASAGW
jgi:hypothetical protein